MGTVRGQGVVKWKACAMLAVTKWDEVTFDSNRMFAQKNGGGGYTNSMWEVKGTRRIGE